MNHREFFGQLAETWNNEEDSFRLKKMLKLINPHTCEKILDVGTGTGILLPLLDTNEVVALDLSHRMLRKAMENSRDFSYFVQGSIERLPLICEYFDCVICFRSFPHFSDKERALAEIRRVLRKNGRLYIAHTTSRDVVNSIHAQIGDVVSGDRIPDNPQMKKMLTDARFRKICVIDQEDLYLVSALKI